MPPGVDAAPDLERLVRRLRTFTPRVWRQHSERVRAAVVTLTELARGAEGLPPKPAPVVADHVLPDVVAVLAHDALAALDERPDDGQRQRLSAVITELLTATS